MKHKGQDARTIGYAKLLNPARESDGLNDPATEPGRDHRDPNSTAMPVSIGGDGGHCAGAGPPQSTHTRCELILHHPSRRQYPPIHT